ncbi:beta strand repeat-containing protein [Caulobacter segnis]
MARISDRRPLILATTALAALMMTSGAALAANTLKINASGAGNSVNSLSITQDATHPSNTISANGLPGGSALLIHGPWASVSINQQGAGNVLKGAFTDATTGGSLTLNYGSAAAGGNNTHSLTIGATTPPVAPTVTVNVVNTDPGTTANTITDVLDGTGLTYSLTVDGTNNAITNTVASTGGSNSLTETFTRRRQYRRQHLGASGAISVTEAVTGSNNSITNTFSGATTITGSITLLSDNNTVTNTSSGAGDKTFSVTLPAANGNTISNAFTGSGVQTSNLTVTGTGSKVDYGLTSSAASVANVILSNVVGAAGAAGNVRVTQTGGGAASLSLTVDGGAFTMGNSLSGGAGILISQTSADASMDITTTPGANGYTISFSQ